MPVNSFRKNHILYDLDAVNHMDYRIFHRFLKNNQSEFVLVIIQYITDYNKHLALKKVLGQEEWANYRSPK